jgi:2-polyprenyl-6-methoxyphenol hydroxylase-like FAD-dependent oxidoreductase
VSPVSAGPAPYDLIVVGAGPVGLFAGLGAAVAGLRCLVIEASPEPAPDSRAIGIHPPALEQLARLGVAEELIGAGVKIRRGHGYSGGGSRIGSLDFGTLDPPWNFVLSVPQWRTEAILEARLQAVAPGSLRRGLRVVGLDDMEGGKGLRAGGSNLRAADSATGMAQPVRVHAVAAEGSGADESLKFRGHYVLACDGRRSVVRSMLGIDWTGGAYPHRYVMADVDMVGVELPGRETENEAAIWVHPEGLVESFPLPDGVRRWVAQAGTGGSLVVGAAGTGPSVAISTLLEAVDRRCGVRLAPEACRNASSFGVERWVAAGFHRGRVMLGGDAAHVVSPIGGQGMNLGWLNVVEAVELVRDELSARRAGPPSAAGAGTFHDAAEAWQRRARQRARRVADRAEQNMLLGNRVRLPWIREVVVRALLSTPLRGVTARRFTMHGVKEEL